MAGRNVVFIFIALLLVVVSSKALYVIKETERGVLLKFGEVINPDVPPGLHVEIPFVNVGERTNVTGSARLRCV